MGVFPLGSDVDAACHGVLAVEGIACRMHSETRCCNYCVEYLAVEGIAGRMHAETRCS